jgi:hypothetical protein
MDDIVRKEMRPAEPVLQYSAPLERDDEPQADWSDWNRWADGRIEAKLEPFCDELVETIGTLNAERAEEARQLRKEIGELREEIRELRAGGAAVRRALVGVQRQQTAGLRPRPIPVVRKTIRGKRA